jgi:hypothetical protein
MQHINNVKTSPNGGGIYNGNTSNFTLRQAVELTSNAPLVLTNEQSFKLPQRWLQQSSNLAGSSNLYGQNLEGKGKASGRSHETSTF